MSNQERMDDPHPCDAHAMGSMNRAPTTEFAVGFRYPRTFDQSWGQSPNPMLKGMCACIGRG